MSNQKRSAAADIIRCLALFFVVSVHFFLNNEFYSQPVEGERMFIMNIMRALFIICVPLFLVLSGYLLRKKELSKAYYARISKIIVTYVLVSIVCMLYSVFVQQKELTVTDMVFKLLDFTGAPYSWYIEMYLGLFLLIPFLNILYNNLASQRHKQILIITFVILTALPSVINVYNVHSPSLWELPTATKDMSKLIPAWWIKLYPITYYFIGCYLSEYGLKIKTTLNGILIVLCTLLSGAYTYWRSYKVKFIWGAWCDYGSLFNVILTVLVFAFFINLNYDRLSSKTASFLRKLSGLCLGGYLVSWVFDSIFYPILLEKVPDMHRRLEYYVIIVPLVFVLSLIASYGISKLQALLEFVYAAIVNGIRNRRTRAE